MNDATKHRIGNYKHSRAKTATTVAPTIRRVHQMDATPQRCKSDVNGQTTTRTGNHAADGFLKCVFLPKLKSTQFIQSCEKTEETERDFYKSLSELAKHYDIEPMPTREYGFPYNTVLARWDMETKLKGTVTNWDKLSLVQASRKTYLVSRERYNTGITLYYIPIVPLFKMLKDPMRKKSALLLVSVCSYLYRIADVPYYRQQGSYLYWQYEMLRDWAEEDGFMEDTALYKNELRQAKCLGDKMEQKLSDPIHLKLLESRITCFQSNNEFDRECYRVAATTFALYTDYPKATIFRNAPIPKEDPDGGYSDETIGMEKYISFVADTNGLVYESLCETINNEFNEYGTLEEPTISKHFDGRETASANLDFENRLFALIDDLCFLLYNYNSKENE